MQHYDSNGWPVIGKYIGLLDDNDNEPIFNKPGLYFNGIKIIQRSYVPEGNIYFMDDRELKFIDYLNKERE